PRGHRGVKIARDGMGLCAARGEDAPQELRQPVALGGGSGGKVPTRVEPLDPAIATRGLLHAEQCPRAPGIGGYVFESCGHAASSMPLRSVTVSDSRMVLPAQSNLLRSGCSVFIQRTVRVEARITTVWVNTASRVKRTPSSREPSVMPVAAKERSPMTMSRIEYLRPRSWMPAAPALVRGVSFSVLTRPSL